jgi:hypothetical protein
VIRRALVGLALLAGFVLAQTPDTLKPQLNPADSMSEANTVGTYRPAKSTGTAVLLSFLLPGGGQVYTGNWWKAALIAPAEVTLGYFSITEHLAATKAWNSGDTTGYVRHRDRRTALLWWTGAALAFSMADAYVSAQMYGFDREMRLTLGPMRAGIAMGF